MDERTDPPRVTRDSPLGDLLAAARDDRMSDEQRVRAWQRVELAAGAAAGAGLAASKATGLFGKLHLLVTWKVGLVSVLVLGAATLATVAAQRATPPAPASTTKGPAQTVSAPPIEARPTATADEAPSPSASAPAREPAPVAPAPSARRAVTGAAPSAEAPQVDEGRILLRAKAAVASDPSLALALTQEHARSYPRSPLATEREAIAREARARLGGCGDAGPGCPR